MPHSATYFSNSYLEAKERFLEKSRHVGATLYELPLDVKGPNGEPLTIDIAWFGSTKPHNVFLHSSGLHGVEGFAGSAIQLRALEAVPQQSKTAFIFVNTLNPYGMAWLRRANENNVDLNRNFCEQDEFTGCPDGYRKLHDLICPASPPGSDAFLLRALWHIAKHGFQSVKRAVAGKFSDET